jgi:hypothetical protein
MFGSAFFFLISRLFPLIFFFRARTQSPGAPEDNKTKGQTKPSEPNMNPLNHMERLYGVHDEIIEELKQKASVFLLHAQAVVSRTTFSRSRVNFKLDVYDKLFHHFKKKLPVNLFI